MLLTRFPSLGLMWVVLCEAFHVRAVWLCAELGPVTGADDSQWTLPADLRRGTWDLQVWFLQEDFMLLNLSVKKDCSGKGWMSCPLVSSGNFSSADKITLVIWKFWCFKLVSDLKWYHLWGFTTIQRSASSSPTTKSWLDKTFHCRREEWWAWPVRPTGPRVPSWESSNRSLSISHLSCWAQSPKGILCFLADMVFSSLRLSEKEVWLLRSLNLLKSAFLLLVMN